MREYFADTWFFVARIDRFDSHHQRARRMDLAGVELVTHDHVLSEVLSFFSDAGATMRQRAAGAVRQALAGITVINADDTLFKRALTLYEARPDKEYSLVDCMSMIVMRDRGVTEVLSNDHHFSQEGFTLVNA
jgi:predicted nucleic acid-binding protein